MCRRFDVDHLVSFCLPAFLLFVIFRALIFLGIFVRRFWRCFFAGFVSRITHEVGAPLFLVILFLKSRGKLSGLGVFGGA
jgi:hypothetical protein